MSPPLELLRLLADGKSHHLETLASALVIEPSRVSALLSDLHELGVECVETPGQGWRWLDPVALLDSRKIVAELGVDSRSLLRSLEVMEEVDSTNRFLMDAAREGAGSGFACVAEFQSRAKGRRGRGFVSPIGNIYQSVLWRFEQDPSFLSGLSVAIGVVVAETCRSLGVAEAGVKWPNDIYWHARKLSGILVETLAGPTQGVAVVVGVGVNFRMAKKPGADIGQPWVDIYTASEVLPNRNTAVALLLEAIVLALDQFSREGFAPFRSRWNLLDVMRDRPVVLHSNGDSTEGTVIGVDDTGALLLSVDGVIQPVITGDVSLRLQE